MKKTIALLCAMAAAVAQADTTPYTLTTTITGTENQQDRFLVTNGVQGTTAIESETSILLVGNVAWNPSYYIPNANVGNADTWTATLSYTLPSDVTSFTLSSIDISGVACNGNGAMQSGDGNTRGVNYTVTVISDGARTEVGTASWQGVLRDDAEGQHKFTASTITLENALELTGDFQLEITATENGASSGCYFGLSGLSLTGTAPVAIPEPATATLSLLALAGLAARRRRK